MPPPPPKRTCLITLGATAPFPTLLTTSLSPPFLSALSAQKYTHLTLQCGADLASAQEWIARLAPELAGYGIRVRAFGFAAKGLGEEMRECKGDEREGRRRGCVVSHAGAGTALDALRLALPLILVPNPELLDNHQVELAEELERMGYAVHGRLEDLAGALGRCEEREVREWNTKESEEEGRGGMGKGKGKGRERGNVMDVVGEELGYSEEVRMEEEVRGVLD